MSFCIKRYTSENPSSSLSFACLLQVPQNRRIGRSAAPVLSFFFAFLFTYFFGSPALLLYARKHLPFSKDDAAPPAFFASFYFQLAKPQDHNPVSSYFCLLTFSLFVFLLVFLSSVSEDFTDLHRFTRVCSRSYCRQQRFFP